MMTLLIGHKRSKRGFTLIELILIMGMIVILVGVTFPMLKGFFGGRTLESEGRRFLTLTRFGQSRAVGEGIPMVLWMNPKKGTYGLEAQEGYLEKDSKAVEYELDEKLDIEVAPSTQNRFALSQEQQLRRKNAMKNTQPEIRFAPDGSVDVMSPESITIRKDKEHALWINQTEDRLKYEVDTEPLQQPRR
jgi:Tfp pilus assembly protein FimT